MTTTITRTCTVDCPEARQLFGPLEDVSAEEIELAHFMGEQIRVAFRDLYRWTGALVLGLALFVGIGALALASLFLPFGMPPLLVAASLIPAGVGCFYAYLGFRGARSDVDCLRELVREMSISG